MRPWSIPALLAGVCAAIGAAAPHSARAESEPGVQPWRVLTQPAPRAAPIRQPSQTYRARRRYDRAVEYPDDWTLGLIMPPLAIPEASLAATPEEQRIRILVVGDSLADALVAGLAADPTLAGDLMVRHKTVSASGLVRDDFHDWAKVVPDLLAERQPLAALVVMLGLNDRQPIRAGGESFDPLSDAWREAYRKRVDAIIEQARAARVPLVWVGLPPMRAQKLSTELAQINAMIRDRVTSAGETFIETFDGFADEAGAFTATGPDVMGDNVRLRGPDGIHFSPSGQRKLAFFVERPLRRRLSERPGSIVPAQPAVATPSASGNPTTISLPVPAAAPPPAIKLREAIGATRPIAPATTANALIGRAPEPLQDPVTRDLFDRGLAPEARPGRADDFRWR